MWYNTQMKAKPPRNYSSKLRNNFQSSLGKEIVNPRERLMNTQKRQKLKELLLDRFSKKYNLGKNRILIEGEITRFLQQEKLNDVDLQRLDAKIKRIITQDISKKTLKKTLTENLNYNQPLTEIDNNMTDLNNIKPEEESIYPTNYQPPKESQINSNNLRAKSSQPNNNNLRPLSSQTYIPQEKLNLYKARTKYKTPEDELAALEKELAEEEEKEKIAKGYYNTVTNPQYKLKQIERTKAELDEQVKEKIKKEYEDELKEKEYDKIFKEHQKELDKIEKEKERLIKEQYLREKESRQAQLKDNYVRKRIDELKERKFDKKIIKNISIKK